MSSLWLPVMQPMRQGCAKLETERGNVCRSGWARLKQTVKCAHLNTYIWRKTHIAVTGRCQKELNASKQILTRISTCMHSVWPALITAFHSFPLLSLTSANHFSVEHERPASQPARLSLLGISAILHNKHYQVWSEDGKGLAIRESTEVTIMIMRVVIVKVLWYGLRHDSRGRQMET